MVKSPTAKTSLVSLLLLVICISYSASAMRRSMGSFNTINSSYVEVDPYSIIRNASQRVAIPSALNIPSENSLSVASNSRRASLNNIAIPPELVIRAIPTSLSINMNSSLEVSEVLSSSSSEDMNLSSLFHLSESDNTDLNLSSSFESSEYQASEADIEEEAGQALVLPEVPCINKEEQKQKKRCFLNASIQTEEEHHPDAIQSSMNDSKGLAVLKQEGSVPLSEVVITNTMIFPVIDDPRIYTKQSNIIFKPFAVAAKQYKEYNISGIGVVAGVEKTTMENLTFGLRYGISKIIAKNKSGNTTILAHTLYPYIFQEEAKFNYLLGSTVSNISIKKDFKKSRGTALSVSSELSKTLDLNNNFKATPRAGLTYNYLNIEAAAGRPQQTIAELILNLGGTLNRDIVLSESTVLTPQVTYSLSKEVWQRYKRHESFLLLKQPNNITHRVGLGVALRKHVHNYRLSYNTYIAPKYRDQELALSYQINF